MRNSLFTAALAALSLAFAGGSAQAQGFGYYMPSEYPGYGVYAPGTSRALSYGVGFAPQYGWYPPPGAIGRNGLPLTPASVYSTPRPTGTSAGFITGSGIAFQGGGFFGRGWRR